ncbi:MAG: nitrile hydratase subunit beta [Alphaproteobacteria bacterium]|nr:nitrile hydratase subunit beta [Alphaproteobacteria bacterium]
MDGIQDLGGMEGFGPIPIEENEPVFHADWEAQVLALRMLMGFWGKWNLDAGRHSVESLPPADYLGFSYYEKWLASLVNLMMGAGLVTADEVAAGHAAPGTQRSTPPADAAALTKFLPRGRPTLREIDAAPRFSAGDLVRTAEHMHSGHTRLPRFARGRTGEIVLHHGAHVFPDTHAKLAGEDPQHLYTVRFAARELWGDEAAPQDTVTVDLWESYLAAA